MLDFIFFIVIFLILFPLVIYPFTLKILNLILRKDIVDLSYDYKPKVTLIVTAYNEEKVILNKLQNILSLKHSFDNFEVIIASDSSSDKTEEIVNDFINNDSIKKFSCVLLRVEGRKGKTHVQNEAVIKSKGDIIVFSDANSMWNKDSLVELVSYFNDESIGYVSGMLNYTNKDLSITSNTETSYWNFDLKIRKMESDIGSTVGGNGAIYAIRKSDYVNLPPILSHDGFMPTKVVLNNRKAKFCDTAIAYERSSENEDDEFGRKVRMQRGQPWKKYYDPQKYNIFKYGLFTYFYIGHKYFKYLLYITHPVALILNIVLSVDSIFYTLILISHITFYALGYLGWKFELKNNFFYFPFYYLMTIIAQWVAVINTLTGKTQAVWEKAESTRK